MSRNLSLLLVVVASLAQSWATFLSLDDADAKIRPVAKVAQLLKDMQKQLGKEAAEDEAIYNKMSCWCATGNKQKTKAIADAKEKIADLSTEIEELTANSAKLGNEIDKIKKELAENQKALDQVIAIREREAKAFKEQEAEALSSISSLRAAVAILKKPISDSFLQQPGSRVLRAMLQRTLDQHAALLDNVLEPSALRAVMSFVQAPDNSYKPKSGEILGVLEQMLETFQGNLEESQAEEKKAGKAFEGLKAAKKAQIAASQKQADDKIKSKSNADKKNAEAKTDLVDTKKALAADEVFLKKLKEKCKATDSQYKERLRLRQDEMEAVSKALTILSGDDARDLFSRAIAYDEKGFLQTEKRSRSLRRTQAAELLTMAAKKLHSSQLSALAYSVRLDAFTQVKKSIDELVSQLLKDQIDEKKQKEFCDNAFKKNKLKTEKKKRQKKDLSARIEALTSGIDKFNNNIADLKEEIADMQQELKEAGEGREQENVAYQQDVAEKRESQKLLKAALRILANVYQKKAAAFIQDGQQDAPKGFKAYAKNKNAGGAIEAIEQIIEDCKEAEEEDTEGEQDAVKTYKEFVEDTNKSIKAKSESLVNAAEAKGKLEVELAEVKDDNEAVEGDLEELEEFKEELHGKCDFLLKNFKVRQASRNDEIEALKQAKAILSGAKFKEFLQQV